MKYQVLFTLLFVALIFSCSSSKIYYEYGSTVYDSTPAKTVKSKIHCNHVFFRSNAFMLEELEKEKSSLTAEAYGLQKFIILKGGYISFALISNTKKEIVGKEWEIIVTDSSEAILLNTTLLDSDPSYRYYAPNGKHKGHELINTTWISYQSISLDTKITSSYFDLKMTNKIREFSATYRVYPNIKKRLSEVVKVK